MDDCCHNRFLLLFRFLECGDVSPLFRSFWISSALPIDHRWRLAVASSVTRGTRVCFPTGGIRRGSQLWCTGKFSTDLCKDLPCNRGTEIFILLVLIYCFCLHSWYLLLLAQRTALQLFNMCKSVCMSKITFLECMNVAYHFQIEELNCHRNGKGTP
jgi:hypothetical protein